MTSKWLGPSAPSGSTCVMVALVLGCDAEPPTTPRPAPIDETCPEENQAPLRNGPGAARPFDCVVVGAAMSGGAIDWPATDALPQPRVFVSARAAAGGDGSQGRPFNDIATGLAALPATGGALVIAHGEYRPAATLMLPAGVVIVGAGAAATQLTVSRGREAMVLAAGRAEVRGLTIHFPEDVTMAADTDLGIAARAGATLTLDDVRVEYARSGVSAEAATVLATRVTVLRSVFSGIDLLRGSRGVFSRLWAHHAGGAARAGYGVYCDSSTVQLSDSMITCNGAPGLWVRYAPAPMSGAASCSGDLSAPTGDTMCWRRVVFDENHGQGVDVSICRPGSIDPRDACPSTPGHISVEGRLLSVRRTLQASAMGGDGILVGPYARLQLDPEASGTSARGLATIVAGNARAGLLVEGPAAVVSVRGATIANNGGPGVYLQSSARAEAFHDSVVTSNTGLGLGVTPSSTLTTATGNRFLATRMGPLSPGMSVMFGDGLALSQPADLTLMTNEFSDNQRYAAFMTQVRSASVTANTGSRNRFEFVAFDTHDMSINLRALNHVEGLETAPTSVPVAPADGMMGP